MPFELLQEDGDLIKLESGDGNVLLEISPAGGLLVITFTDEEVFPSQPSEETTPAYRASLVDEDDAQFRLEWIEAMLVSVDDDSSSTVLRPVQDGLNANDVTITDDGSATTLTFIAQLNETRLVAADSASEIRNVTFEFAWESGKTINETDPIAAANNDTTLTVTASAHGLTDATGPHQIFIVSPDDKVGGVCINGGHRVTEIVDANTLRVEARSVATSTVTGGGATIILINSRVGKHVKKMTVVASETAC